MIIEAHQVNQTRIGLGYIDDCFAISLNYMTELQLQRHHDDGQQGDADRQFAHDRRLEFQPGYQSRYAGTGGTGLF